MAELKMGTVAEWPIAKTGIDWGELERQLLAGEVVTFTSDDPGTMKRLSNNARTGLNRRVFPRNVETTQKGGVLYIRLRPE